MDWNGVLGPLWERGGGKGADRQEERGTWRTVERMWQMRGGCKSLGCEGLLFAKVRLDGSALLCMGTLKLGLWFYRKCSQPVAEHSTVKLLTQIPVALLVYSAAAISPSLPSMVRGVLRAAAAPSSRGSLNNIISMLTYCLVFRQMRCESRAHHCSLLPLPRLVLFWHIQPWVLAGLVPWAAFVSEQVCCAGWLRSAGCCKRQPSP